MWRGLRTLCYTELEIAKGECQVTGRRRTKAAAKINKGVIVSSVVCDGGLRLQPLRCYSQG